MRNLQWFIISLSLTACANHQLKYQKVPQMPPPPTTASLEQNQNKTYLALDLPYAPFESLRRQVESAQKIVLKNRGEAHITVLTPPEFKRLEKKISMKEINELAQQLKLQESPYRPLCVGKGKGPSAPDLGETYFVVMEAEKLFEIRQKILALYVAKGGNAKDFDPEVFYPHVTLGFTQRDLHLEDGVIKDASACVYSLSVSE